MNITYISNFFNHHQKFTSEMFFEKCDHYHFIETTEVPEERRSMGYQSDFSEEYLLGSNSGGAKEVIAESDVVIIGSAPYSLLKNVKQQCLVFRYSERPFKKKIRLYKYPYRYLRWKRDFMRVKRHYLLTSGAFAYADYLKFGFFRNKAYKWGYFPETKHYELHGLLDKKDTKELLWCGRFLDWKHPDDAVEVAKMLKADGVDFRLSIIGVGEMEQQLRHMVNAYDLRDRVRFLGAKTPEQVREHMEKSGIFLMTSDRKEGWGAVLNEAMNAACAVVASDEIGSVPYLAKNKENALVYHAADTDALYKKTRYLLENPTEQQRLGKAAYHTIISEWNAEVAAERLMQLAQTILDGEEHPDLFSSGPCSRSEIIKDDWFKEDEEFN